MNGTETLRCRRAETTRDCPVSHQWTQSNGVKKAYHATTSIDLAAKGFQPCAQCNRPMNPVEVMLGPVCGKCVRANHVAAVR